MLKFEYVSKEEISSISFSEIGDLYKEKGIISSSFPKIIFFGLSFGTKFTGNSLNEWILL